MTKEWTSYAQMSQVPGFSPSEGEGTGLSEESEALLWAKAHGGEGVGEVIYEQDLRDLGLVE